MNVITDLLFTITILGEKTYLIIILLHYRYFFCNKERFVLII